MAIKIRTEGQVIANELAVSDRLEGDGVIFRGSGIQVVNNIISGIDDPWITVDSLRFTSSAKKFYQVSVPSAGVITLSAAVSQNFTTDLTTTSTRIELTDMAGEFDRSLVIDLKITQVGCQLNWTGYYFNSAIVPTLSQTIGVIDTFSFIKGYDPATTYVMYKRGFAPSTVTVSGLNKAERKEIEQKPVIANSRPTLKSYTKRGDPIPEVRTTKRTFFDETTFVADGIVYADREEDGVVIQGSLPVKSTERGKLDGELLVNNPIFEWVRVGRRTAPVDAGVATIDCTSTVHLLFHDQDVTLDIVNLPANIDGSMFQVMIIRKKDDTTTLRLIDWENSGAIFYNTLDLTQTENAEDLIWLTTIDGGVTWSCSFSRNFLVV